MTPATSTPVTPVVLPEPAAIVSADEVAGRIAAVRAELASLEAELVRTLAEADALEAEAGDGDVDAVSHELVAGRLQRFLDGLRAEVNGDIDALLRTAAECGRRASTASGSVRVEVPAVGAVQPEPSPPPSVPVAVPQVPVPTSPDAPPPTDVVGADVGADEPERVLESEFWSDQPERSGWLHVRTTLRTVGWQSVAVLCVLVALLIRIG